MGQYRRGFSRFSGITAIYREEPMLLRLSIMMTMVMLGFGMIVPIIPLYGRTFDVSSAMVGLLVTSFGVARMLSNFPAGRIADRVGRRPLVMFGPLVSATGALLAGLAPSYWFLIGALAIQGVGSAIYATSAMTILADISTAEKRGRMMALFQGSLLLGASFGPTVGGAIAGFFDYNVVFFFAMGIYLLVTTWAFLQIRETLPAITGIESEESKSRNGADAPSPFLMLANLSFLAVALVSVSIFFTRTGGRSTIIPLKAAEDFAMTPTMIGALLTLTALLNVATLPFTGWAIDRFGRKAVIVPSTIVSACGILIFAQAPSIPILYLGAGILGVGTGIAGPAPAAYVADLAQGQNYGSLMGMFRTISDFGFVSGPFLLGWLSDLEGFAFALMVNAGFLFSAGLVFWFFAREVPRANPQAIQRESHANRDSFANQHDT